MVKNDINNRADIELLIKAFYDKMVKDIIIGFMFTQVAKVDLDKHLPIICDFWETILFKNNKYKRGMEFLKVHTELDKKVPLKKGHFVRWLYLFNSSVDDLFEGANAQLAKDKAAFIAESIQKRLSII